MLQRRAVLAALGGAMAATIVPFKSHAGTNLSTRQQFAELLGARFRLTDADGHSWAARLVAVDDGPRCPGLEQYSIVFEGRELTEGLYEVYPRESGRLNIGLTSLGGSDTGAARLQACFSNFI
jgi:hypothetical protein